MRVGERSGRRERGQGAEREVRAQRERSGRRERGQGAEREVRAQRERSGQEREVRVQRERSGSRKRGQDRRERSGRRERGQGAEREVRAQRERSGRRERGPDGRERSRREREVRTGERGQDGRERSGRRERGQGGDAPQGLLRARSLEAGPCGAWAESSAGGRGPPRAREAAPSASPCESGSTHPCARGPACREQPIRTSVPAGTTAAKPCRISPYKVVAWVLLGGCLGVTRWLLGCY